VQKSGGEKALTKHLHDDLEAKLPISLDNRIKMMSSNEDLTAMVVSRAKAIPGLDAPPVLPKNRIKVSSVKIRFGKIMHKLYDLEPHCAPEKSLNVDLGVDLYQMENY
jgi:hypothetical protein